MTKIMVLSTNKIVNDKIKRVVYEDIFFNAKEINLNVIKRYLNKERPKLLIIHHSANCLNLSPLMEYLVTNKIIPIIYISNKSTYSHFYNIAEDVYFTHIKQSHLENLLPTIIPIFIKIRDQITILNKTITKLETTIENHDVILKAKIKLIEARNLTEDEAHKYIIKLAMDKRLTKEKIAHMILKQEI